MSLTTQSEYKCRYCEKTHTRTIWHSINTEKNPEAKELLLSGELFMYHCPHCGCPVIAPYSMLYHDPELSLMIYFVVNEKDLQEATLALNMIPAPITKRIVSNLAFFKEKVMIFSNNLDDRVIEFIKFFAHRQVLEQKPGTNINFLTLTEHNPQYKFKVSCDEPFDIVIPSDKAKPLVETLNKYLPDKNDNYFIDADWVLSFLNNNQNNMSEFLTELLSNRKTSAVKESSEKTVIKQPVSEPSHAIKKQKKSLKKPHIGKRMTALLIIIALLLASSVAGNIYQAYTNQTMQAEIASLEEIKDDNESKIENLEARVSVLNRHNNNLKETMSSYEEQIDSYGKKIDSYEKKITFYEKNVVIVVDNNTNKYHKYGCILGRISGYDYWVYSIKDAPLKGYTPCRFCCD